MLHHLSLNLNLVLSSLGRSLTPHDHLQGGALFGFDISSMSAIIATTPYKCQYNAQVSISLFNDVCSVTR